MKEITCKKCNWRLLYIEPSHSMSHCGTDYWTMRGERRWKPLICMACRTKVGKHAKKEQDKQVVQSETDRHVKLLNNALQRLRF